MPLSPQFLDDLRARTVLSSLVGRSVRLKKAGREFKGCCPFHTEKTASFTVNDEKGFYHCFGCGAHGDAIRWLTDAGGLAFIDAVRELAAAAGIEMPPRSAEDGRREAEAASHHDVLEKAAAWYAEQLAGDAKALAELEARGIGPAGIAKFGIGYAPPKRSVGGCGVKPPDLAAAGLLLHDPKSDLYRDRFLKRIMVPIHDHRGRMVGFAGRYLGEPAPDRPHPTHRDPPPKYLNSPDSPRFDKGDLLFNLHRASAAARKARRLLIVEGPLDVIALDAAGLEETVAPQGTALTDRQLERAWRVIETPVLLFDGDRAGRSAALRAAEKAIPHVGPGRSLSIATLPEGEDPDSLVRSAGAAAVEEVIAAAEPLAAWLWRVLLADAEGEDGRPVSPEARAGLWKRLAGLARTIRDEETRGHYLADWRSRFDSRYPPLPPGLDFDDTVPDGSQANVAELTEVERERLRRITAAWLERRGDRMLASVEAATRFAWEVGRRVASGLIDQADGASIVSDLIFDVLRLFEGAKQADIERAYEFGFKRGFDPGPLLTTLKLSGYPMTDKGNAMRFVDRFGDSFRYTTAFGWLGWDGRRWKVLDQEKEGPPPAEVQAAVFDTIDAIQWEARRVAETRAKLMLKGAGKDRELDLGSEDAAALDHWVQVGRQWKLHSQILAGWGMASQSAGRLGCIPNLARRWLTKRIEDFDHDQYALNVLNGTLRFHSEEQDAGPGMAKRRSWWSLEPHRREDLLTKLAPVTWDPKARSPRYDKMIAWAQPDEEVRRYLHQVGGLGLTGDAGEQKLWFWWGRGRNGKGTTIESWCHVAGDYGDTILIESFLDQGIKKRGDQASPDMAKLGGVRMLRCSEPDKGAKLNSGLIKLVTGGEPLPTRALHRGFFNLTVQFKLIVSGNSKPNIPDTDEGIWSRMKLVPWLRNIEKPPEPRPPDWPEKDPHLVDKIKAEEGSGVLRRLVEGLLDYLANGFVEPDAVAEATATYRDQSDPLARFLRFCTEPDPNGRVQSSTLHEVFIAWCKAAGETEWSPKRFKHEMLDKGFKDVVSNGVKWPGLRLIREVHDLIDTQTGKAKTLPDEEPPPLAATAQPRAPPGDDFVPGFDPEPSSYFGNDERDDPSSPEG